MSAEPGTLFVVATPIGNLGDITLRAKETLQSVAVIASEDTRVTRKLLSAYDISTPLVTCQEHTDARGIRSIVDKLLVGDNVAVVTDAGTPGISDPGGALVCDAEKAGVKIVPIPGPSAVITALSIAGFMATPFTFLGFPPHKKGRETFFRELGEISHTVVLYESTHRIEKTLTALAPHGRQLVVCRELTKLHETIYRGKAEEILEALRKTSSKGEFVIIIAPSRS